jgi:hypothetical protein
MSDSIPEVLRPVDRRQPRAVLLMLAGIALGSVLMLGLLALTGAVGNAEGTSTEPIGGASGGMEMPTPSMTGSMPASPSTGPSGSMGEGAMSIEAALRMHVPAEVAPTCMADDLHDASAFSYFSLVCKPKEGADEVQYSSFHDAVAMRFKFTNDFSQAGIDPDGPACSRSIDRGVTGWWAPEPMGVDGAITHEVGGDRSMAATSGRVMCYVQGGRAWIEWYDGDTHIFAWASAAEDAWPQLWDWWSMQAGPYHPRMTDMGM